MLRQCNRTGARLQRLVPHEEERAAIADHHRCVQPFLLCCQIAVKLTRCMEAYLMLRFASMDCRNSFTRITGALCQQAPGGLSRLSMRWFG